MNKLWTNRPNLSSEVVITFHEQHILQISQRCLDSQAVLTVHPHQMNPSFLDTIQTVPDISRTYSHADDVVMPHHGHIDNRFDVDTIGRNVTAVAGREFIEKRLSYGDNEIDRVSDVHIRGAKVYEWEMGEETKEDAREHEFSASSNLFPGVECPQCGCHWDTANDKGVREREKTILQ